MPGHVMTLRIFGALKSCDFREISKKCLINSTPQVELKKCYMRSHMSCRSSCLTKVKREESQRF